MIVQNVFGCEVSGSAILDLVTFWGLATFASRPQQQQLRPGIRVRFFSGTAFSLLQPRRIASVWTTTFELNQQERLNDD